MPATFTPSEVSLHNHADDCWVSFFGDVYDLTTLINSYKGTLAAPILRFAGQDISHWFDVDAQDGKASVKTHIDPTTNLEVPYTPFGRFIHVPPTEPDANWTTDFGTPWWKDDRYNVGKLTRKTTRIKLVNMLTQHEHIMEVPVEETLEDIRERYLEYNQHAKSYTWKRLGKKLDMKKPLAENNVTDESDEFDRLNIPEDAYIPAIHLYYDDDLTVQ